jgi:hypothetical protein
MSSGQDLPSQRRFGGTLAVSGHTGGRHRDIGLVS